MKYHILQINLTDAEVDLINEKGHDAVARHARHLNVTISDKFDDLLIHDYDHVADFYTNSLAEVVNLGNADIDRKNHPQINIVADHPDQGLASISEGDIIINSETLKCYYDTGYKFIALDVKPEELIGLIFSSPTSKSINTLEVA
tara:strand:+ start:191 stop:625 length:435 start_codon:yes stop_codon:yes gene_type:complete